MPQTRSKKSKKQEPPSGFSGNCKALLRSGAEAVFGDLSGVGFKHLLLQAVNLGERDLNGEGGVLTNLFSFFFSFFDLNRPSLLFPLSFSTSSLNATQALSSRPR